MKEIKRRTNSVAIVGAAIWLMLCSPNSAVAESVTEVIELSDRAIVLTGWGARHTTWIEVPVASSRVELELIVSGSSILDTERSVVTVLVDELPVKTARLSAAQSGLRVPVDARPGFRRIDVISKPIVEDDPCLARHRQEAWVRLEPSTQVVFDRAPNEDPKSPETAPVSRITEAWREFSSVSIRATGAAEYWVSASIAADHWMRDLGLEPEYETRRPAGISIEYRSLPDGVRGVAERDNVGLNIAAKSEADARATLLALRDPARLALCARSTCIITDEHRPSFEDTRSRDDVTVLDRIDSWTTLPDNEARLRITWDRPDDWEVLPFPSITFEASVDTTTKWSEPPSVDVILNDIPIAAFELVHTGSRQFAANIPRAFWEARNWTLELRPRLTRDDRHCFRRSPDAGWLTVTAVRLDVPRKTVTYDGLHPFAGAQRLDGLVGSPEALRAQRATLGAVTYILGLAPRLAGRDCTNCLVVKDIAESEQFALGDESWVQAELGVALAADHSMLITRDEDDVALYVPRALSPPSPPPPPVLRGDRAVWTGQEWVALGRPRPVETTAVRPAKLTAPKVESSVEAQRLRRFHFAWLMLVCVAAAAAAFWLWRTRRLSLQRHDGNIEVFK